jgi:chromosome segregation ATPase
MAENNPQDRIAELELQLEASQKENAEVKTKLVEAEKQAADNLALASVVEKKRAELEEEVKKLQDKNAKFENPSFTHGDEVYEILVKHAKVPGVGPVTAADIVADKDLQETLVAKQSGIIRKKA